MPIPVQSLMVVSNTSVFSKRRLIGVLSDSGMRLAKAVGLTKEDVVLKADVPEIWLQRTKFWQKNAGRVGYPYRLPSNPTCA